MAKINQLDQLVDLDSLFATDFKQSSGNEIEEDNIFWNVFLINTAINDFCVSFPKDLTRKSNYLTNKMSKFLDKNIDFYYYS